MLLPITVAASGDAVDTLIQRIEETGNVKDGFKYIALSVDAFTQTATVTYRNDINCLDFCFTYSIDVSVGTVEQYVHFFYDIDAKAALLPLSYAYCGKNGSTPIMLYECTAEFDIPKYDGETPILFEPADDPAHVYTFPSAEDYNEDGNSALKLAVTVWDILLMTDGGVQLRDIGFVSYGSEQSGPTPDVPEIVASGACGSGVIWSLDDNGLLKITGTGMMSNFSFASAPWYQYRKSIKKVYVGDGVLNIGDLAFYGCDELMDIALPDSMKTIGRNAFWSCERLKGIVLPAKLTGIGDYAFEDCYALESVVIPASVIMIGTFAFWNCRSLSDVTMEYGVRSIGGDAFCGCVSLSSIVIPDSVRELGVLTFNKCTMLTDVTLSGSISSVPSGTFQDCINLNMVSIPASVERIGSEAFKNCWNLHINYAGSRSQWNNIRIDYSENPEIDLDKIIYGGKSAVTAALLAGGKALKISDPDGILTDDAIVFAARYEQEQMLDAVCGNLSEEGIVSFNKALNENHVLFILDRNSYVPFCGIVSLKASP